MENWIGTVALIVFLVLGWFVQYKKYGAKHATILWVIFVVVGIICTWLIHQFGPIIILVVAVIMGLVVWILDKKGII